MADKYRVTATTLNVREAPSITEKVIGYLHKADTVDLISKSGDGYWFRIKKGGLEGWASHKYLKPVHKSDWNSPTGRFDLFFDNR